MPRNDVQEQLDVLNGHVREAWEWVWIALDAGGWETVFDIPDWKERARTLPHVGGFEYPDPSVTKVVELVEAAQAVVLEHRVAERWRSHVDPALLKLSEALARIEP